MNRKTNAGFTLIELMIVVAIIGVLAVLAIFGVSKYLKTAKTAEATNTLGQINQDAAFAYEKERTPSAVVVGPVGPNIHALCPSSNGSIPATVPSNKKYTAGIAIYQADPGFNCLGFSMSQPQYFAYDYVLGGPSAVAGDATVAGLAGWGTGAAADFIGDGKLVEFATGGNIVNGTPVMATSIASFDQSNGKPL
ncbi:MAG: prepilin-type N-terminal cleavage/methylation domain-containing protein [Polyangiaceae bacterium]